MERGQAERSEAGGEATASVTRITDNLCIHPSQRKNGGRFTLGPAEATRVADQLRPKVVIPMHFKTDKCGFPIEPVNLFLDGKPEIKRSPTSEVILHKKDLPANCTVLYIPPGN